MLFDGMGQSPMCVNSSILNKVPEIPIHVFINILYPKEYLKLIPSGYKQNDSPIISTVTQKNLP